MRSLRWMLVALVLASAACKDSGAGPTEEGIDGTYQLQTVQGPDDPQPKTMPYILHKDAASTDQVDSQELLLTKEGPYTFTTVLRHIQTGQQDVMTTNVVAGTWTQPQSTTITFMESGAGSYSGTVGSRQITISDSDGYTRIFKKK